MEASQFAARLTCFALLSAIEIDLRHLIETVARKAGKTDVLPTTVRENATSRWRQSKDAIDQLVGCDDFQLLEFTDFADLAQLLHMHISEFWQLEPQSVKTIAKNLETLSPARNRVCHSRPLEPDDFSSFYDFTKLLVKIKNTAGWVNTIACLDKLRDQPGFVLQLSIPDFWKADTSGFHHNLPLPEFDDTGFLGRANDRSELGKLIISAHPVITVVGQGGMGKTALTLRCLYDLVAQPDRNPFEAIIWCTLKSRVLTQAGVKDLGNSITTTLGLVENLAGQLGVSRPSPNNINNSFEEIAEYLKAFRLLLAIDNLETIGVQSLRPLLTSVGAGSKILLTSRVGLGELELRYPLEPMDSRTAQTLFRRYSKINQLNQLASAPQNLAEKYCSLLHHNPLLIRWFISSVSAGADPGRILSRQGKPFTEVLRFCFENLFERLSEYEKTILWTLACVQRPVSQTELIYLCNNIPQDDFDWAQNTLMRSSMLKTVQEHHTGATIIPRNLYTLTEISSDYVSQLAPPPRAIFTHVQGRLKELKTLAETEAAKANAFKYDTTAIRASNSDERIAAAFLRRAMNLARSQLADARTELDEARRFAPTYSEVYRVAGWIEGPNDTYKALREFNAALEINPESEITRYSFAHFLVRYLEDYDLALEQLDWLLQRDPDEPAILSLKAVALTRSGKYWDAEPLYETLLSTLDQRPRRWRITTFDQAVECFRRWAELDSRNNDYCTAFTRFRKCLQFLTMAFDAGDYDAKLLELAAEVLTFATKLLSHPGVGTAERDLILQFSNKYSNLLDSPSYIERGEQEQTEHSTYVLGQSGVRGVVVRLPPDLPYGFINTPDGREWFFHRSNLAYGVRWNSLRVGQHVLFEVSRNHSGLCAADVRVL